MKILPPLKMTLPSTHALPSLSFLITALAMLFLFPFNSRAQNLVANGSFDNSGANWTFFAPATGTETGLFETTYGGTVGTNRVAEVDNQANLRQTGINVIAGKTYWLSFKHSRRTGNGAAANPTMVRIKVYNGIAMYLDQIVSSTNAAWSWQCETFQFTTISNVVSIDISNVVPPGQTSSSLGTIMDDITITPVEQLIVLNGFTCQGGTLTLKAPGTPGNGNEVYTGYSWTGPNGFTATGANITFNDLQPVKSGIYNCNMSLNGCLSVSGTYDLLVLPTVFSITKEICEGSTYNFHGRILFQSGSYDTLIAHGNNMCDSFIHLQLTVVPMPDVSITPSTDLVICKGDTAVLKVAYPEGSTGYQWYAGNLIAFGETAPQYKSAESDVYYYVAQSNKGCIDTSDVITVQVNPLPDARIITGNLANVCLSDTLKFEAEAGAFHYSWQPEPYFRAASQYGSNIGNAVIKNKSTEIVLTVYDRDGCHNSDSLRVIAKNCCTIFIPNAFSPNGDGVNDLFFPTMRGEQLLVSFTIYDRWGKLVYASAAGDRNGWNGNYPDGTPANAGVYMFNMEYTCAEGNNRGEKGDIILIR